jgi:hypothetical protein
MEVRHKKSASVMIYESPNRGTMMYTIAYPSDGQRRRRMRRDFEEAFALAREIALKMSDGALSVLTLDGRERFVYERAVELAATTGMELDALVTRAVEASNIAGGPDHVIEAARLFASQQRGVVDKMVSEVVTELIENRRSNEASQLYLREALRQLADQRRLPRAVTCYQPSFTCNLNGLAITQADLRPRFQSTLNVECTDPAPLPASEVFLSRNQWVQEWLATPM